jgi:hypothetical protein
MNTVLWWTGAVTWAVVGLLLLWLLAEVVRASVPAASSVRFTWRAARLRGIPAYPAVFRLPLLFLRRWGMCLGYRPGQLVFREQNGVWNGVGAWCAYRPAAPVAAVLTQKAGV